MKKNLTSIEVPADRSVKNGPMHVIWPRSIPFWMAVFYLIIFIIRPWEQLFPWLQTIRLEKIYGIFMIIVAILWGNKYALANRQTFVVVLFFLSIIISAVFAVNPSIAWDSVYFYMTIVAFYFVISMVIRSPHDLFFCVIFYILTMAAYLTKSQWEFFVHGQHRYDMGVYRLIGIESTFGGPNSLAMSIVVSLPMLVFLWVSRKKITSDWPQLWKRLFTPFLLLYFMLATSSIVLTNSRSGMLGIVFFVVLTVLSGKGFFRKVVYTLSGAIVLSILWQVMPYEHKGRFQTIFDPESGPKSAHVSAEGRIEGFKAGMAMCHKFPLTGVGVGNFIEYRASHVDGVSLEAHNLAGELLGQTGLVGGIVFSLVLVVIIINRLKVSAIARRYPANETLVMLSGLTRASWQALVLLLFEGFFGHNLLRYNWLWLAAFTSLALQFAKDMASKEVLTDVHC